MDSPILEKSSQVVYDVKELEIEFVFLGIGNCQVTF